MASLLPLFPLNIVVFPGEKLNLHIFENRYRQLVLDCHATNTVFGMPVFINNSVTEFGTSLRISHIEKTHAGGEMDIKTKGEKIFKIKKLLKTMPGKLYAGAEVEFTDELTTEPDPMLRLAVREYLQKFYEVLQINSLVLMPSEKFTAYSLGHHLGLSVAQEYQLLQLGDENQRLEFLLEHLRKVVPILEETEKLKERIKLNGHFKNITPPEF